MTHQPSFDFGRTLKNAGYMVAGQGVSGVCQFLRSALIARYVGPAEYGAWGFAFAFVSMFVAVADFGLSTLMVRDLATGRADGAYFGTALRLKAVMNVGLALAMVAIEPLVDRGGEARALVYVMGLQMFLASTSLVFFALFRSRERMLIESLISGGVSALSLALAAALIAAEASMVQIAGSYAVCTAMGGAVAVIMGRRLMPAGLVWRSAEARSLLKETWPIGVGMMATSVYYFYDRVLMGALGQQTEVGWYTAAYSPVLWLTGIITVVRTAYLPAQSRALAGQEDAKPVLTSYAGVSVALGLPIAVGGFFLSGDVITAVYGNAYAPATPAMQVLLGTTAVMFMSSFLGSNLLAAGRQRRYLAAVVAGAVTNVALNSFMVPLWSLDGAAVATLVSEVVVAAALLRGSRGVVALPSWTLSARAPLAASALLAGVLLVTLPLLNFVAAAALGGAAYAGVMALTWRSRVVGASQSRPQSFAA